MKVTAATKTAEGTKFELNNGDALLIKETVGFTGKPLAYPVYLFVNGRRYSASTGRFSGTTIIPAMSAVRRFLAA